MSEPTVRGREDFGLGGLDMAPIRRSLVRTLAAAANVRADDSLVILSDDGHMDIAIGDVVDPDGGCCTVVRIID
jgi:hypothetical protein